MATKRYEKLDIHELREQRDNVLSEMEALNKRCLVENRDFNVSERDQWHGYETDIAELDRYIQHEEEARTRPGYERSGSMSDAEVFYRQNQKAALGNGSGIGAAIVRAGWSLRDQPRVEIAVNELRNSFPPVVDQSPRVIEGINPLGRDERFLWPRLPSQDIGSDTSVNDFRQTNREVTGDVERALDQTDEKASLSLSVEHVTEEVRQLAVMIEDIPNVVLESLSTTQEFFNAEATYQLNAELDRHVFDRIVAADPPSDAQGDNLIEQVRNAISAMRLVGSVPSMLILNPSDAAQLDLFMQPGSGDYAYDRSQVGGASPLWGLQVIERTGESGDEPPVLLDPQRLGLVYTGIMAFLANPYLKANQNLTDLRFEMRVLAHIRRADAAYIIVDTNGNGNG